jgi:hypothetical protein
MKVPLRLKHFIQPMIQEKICSLQPGFCALYAAGRGDLFVFHIGFVQVVIFAHDLLVMRTENVLRNSRDFILGVSLIDIEVLLQHVH